MYFFNQSIFYTAAETEITCNDDEWKCDIARCIPNYFRCDLIFHCYDKTDEIDCGM